LQSKEWTGNRRARDGAGRLPIFSGTEFNHEPHKIHEGGYGRGELRRAPDLNTKIAKRTKTAGTDTDMESRITIKSRIRIRGVIYSR